MRESLSKGRSRGCVALWLYLLILATVGCRQDNDDDESGPILVNTPAERPPIMLAAATPKTPSSDLRLGQAIEKAVRNIQRSKVRPEYMIVFIRLGEIYGIDTFVDMRNRYARASRAVTGEYANRMRIYERILDQSIVASRESLAALKGFDAITMAALYCDLYPFEKDVLESWSQELSKGGYEATHVALAYRFARDNDCEIPGFSPSFEQTMVESILSLIHVEDGLSEVELEAMTFLALLNKEYLFGSDWIDRVIDAQRDDGGWGDGWAGNTHATGLGLWLLLDIESRNTLSPVFLDRSAEATDQAHR